MGTPRSMVSCVLSIPPCVMNNRTLGCATENNATLKRNSS
jgi:hypothetical protein